MKAARLHEYHKPRPQDESPTRSSPPPSTSSCASARPACAGPTCISGGQCEQPTGGRCCRTPSGTRTPAGSRRSARPSPTWPRRQGDPAPAITCGLCWLPRRRRRALRQHSFPGVHRRRLRRVHHDRRSVGHPARPLARADRRGAARRRRPHRLPRHQEGAAAALPGAPVRRDRRRRARAHRHPVPAGDERHAIIVVDANPAALELARDWAPTTPSSSTATRSRRCRS